MLKVSEKVAEYLEKSEKVQKFDSVLFYDEEEAKKGKKMSLIRCLESILGVRDGEIKIDEEGTVILDDGKREFVLADFHCGFDYDFSAYIELFNKQENYMLVFDFPFDDVYIGQCSIKEKVENGEITHSYKKERNVVNQDGNRRNNTTLLDEVERIIEENYGTKCNSPAGTRRNDLIDRIKTIVPGIQENSSSNKNIPEDRDDDER